MEIRRELVLLVLGLGLSSYALAYDSPVGKWKTIDDETHQAKALVEINETSTGELTAKVVTLLQNPNAVCDHCEGALKGKPVQGMTILWGMKQDGKTWSGGRILDPKSGKVYSAKMTLLPDGKKLEVRGYLGISLLGRSQVWERQ